MRSVGRNIMGSKPLKIVRMLKESILDTFEICVHAAKRQTYVLLGFSIILTLLSLGTSTYNARAVSKATEVIKAGVGKFSDGAPHATSEIFSFAWQHGLVAALLGYFGFFSLNSFAVLLRNFWSSDWNSLIRYEVDRRIRQLRDRLDIGRLTSVSYEGKKHQIIEQPFGFSAILQFAQVLIMGVMNLTNAIVFGAGLLFINPKIALLVLFSVSIRAVVEFYWDNVWWKFGDAEVPFSKRRGIIASLFSNVIPLFDLKMAGSPTVVDELIRNSQRAHIERKKPIRKRVFGWQLLSEVAGNIIICMIVLYGSITALQKGNITIFVLVLDFSLRTASNLRSVLFDLTESWKAARTTHMITREYLRLEPLIPCKGVEAPHGFDTISFKDVGFAYPVIRSIEDEGNGDVVSVNEMQTAIPVLVGVNLVIRHGQKVAIVGPSGGGKTTLTSLLMRQFDPTEGSILIDDLPLKEINPRFWAERMVVLGQDFSMPHGTIREALCISAWNFNPSAVLRDEEFGVSFGVDSVPQDTLEDVCRQAAILDVILGKPGGFNALIGKDQGGIELSKGEKQRFALAARLLAVKLFQLPILIVDEPDASLDVKTREVVMEGIMSTDTTVFMVLHNLQACRHCDLIVCVKDGRVVEQGSHEELLALGGEYRGLFYKSMRGFLEKDDSESHHNDTEQELTTGKPVLVVAQT